MKIAAYMGDGIGPEIVGASLGVLEDLCVHCGIRLDVTVHPIGLAALADHGTTFPESSRRAAVEADGIILGPLDTSTYREVGGVNVSAELRQKLDMFANIRPNRSFPGVPSVCAKMDVVVVRENTEGFYAARAMEAGSGEFAPDRESAFSLRKITAKCSRRIAKRAFELASTRRRHVTVIHKANVLPVTDGLFVRECKAVQCSYPKIQCQELLVDAAASKLVADNGTMDVLLTTNLFGDILSNEAAALTGGLGLSGSINHGERHVMAQACHGAAPDIAGEGIANPTSLLLSIALLLNHLGQTRVIPELNGAAEVLEASVAAALLTSKTRTPDVGGNATTKEFAANVLSSMRSRKLSVYEDQRGRRTTCTS